MSPRLRWIIVGTFALLPLLGWWLYGLFDVDEGFYAAAAAEMNRRGEWITPFYNGSPWFEKPILLYWLSKPFLALFGPAFGLRLPSVLATLATYSIVGWFAKRRFGDDVAQMAVLVLAGSFLMVGVGRMMLTDPLLNLALVVAFTSLWESLIPKTSVGPGPAGFRLISAVALGFGVLAKGPVALILFVIIAGWVFWRQPALRPSFRGYWALGTLLLVAVISSWYVPAFLQDGQVFVQKFLIEQNVGRFTGGDPAHTLGGFTSLVFYIPIVLLGMFPWSLFIPSCYLSTLRDARLHAEGSGGENSPVERYLVVWASAVFLFFTISGAKLPHYVLPALPPLAILVALRLNSAAALKAAMVWCACMAIVATGVSIWWYARSGQRELHALATYLRNEGGPVAVYQMSRRQTDRGTGSTQLQETSQPSILVYLNANVLDTDDFSRILAAPVPEWVLTRANRITPLDFVAARRAGLELDEIHLAWPSVNYKVYRLSQNHTDQRL